MAVVIMNDERLNYYEGQDERYLQAKSRSGKLTIHSWIFNCVIIDSKNNWVGLICEVGENFIS